MGTNEENKGITKVIVPQEVREQIGAKENEIFGIEEIGENTVQLKSLGIDANYQKAEIPKDLAEKLESIGIKKEYVHPIRTPGKDYTMIMLKLPTTNE